MTANKQFREEIIGQVIPDYVEWEVNGNFTLCRVVLGSRSAMGCTKRNPRTDEDDFVLAKDIAYYRAMRKLWQKIHS